MAILAIDTSGSYCSVALSSNQGCVNVSSNTANDHFERLPGIVSEALKRASLSAEAVKEIRIGLGPGSFTGLRIGMSFAKGLACSLRIPVVGYSSFAAIAARFFERGATTRSVVVLADARREEVFVAKYTEGREEIAPCIVPSAALRGGPWRLGEADVSAVSPQADLELPGCAAVVETECAQGLLLLPPVIEGSFSVSEISVIEPTYLRAVAAKTIAERKLGA